MSVTVLNGALHTAYLWTGSNELQITSNPCFCSPCSCCTIRKKFCEPLKDLIPINADMNSIPEKDQTLLYDQLDKVPEVKEEILKLFSGFINQLLTTPEQKWQITSSWVTENTNGVRMERHQHLNSYYSAVLYFSEVDKEHAPLLLESPINPFGFFVRTQNLTCTLEMILQLQCLKELFYFSQVICFIDTNHTKLRKYQENHWLVTLFLLVSMERMIRL